MDGSQTNTQDSESSWHANVRNYMRVELHGKPCMSERQPLLPKLHPYIQRMKSMPIMQLKSPTT